MYKYKFKFILPSLSLLLLSLGISNMAVAQDKVSVDQIIAVVGNSAVLESELIAEKNQLQTQGVFLGDQPFCALLNEVLYQKLLYHQALIDSVEVSETQVEQELERRLRFFIQQIGSRERLEAYYGMSIEEIKDDFRDMVREQQISNAMEQKIGRNIRVTPSEVKKFYNNLPEDSIPIVEMEMQLAQIVIKPPIRDEEIQRIKDDLNNYRDRVLRGESFNTLAILYSEDPGSARKGGELGFYGRGELFPEFEAVAFGLKPGEVSDIVETSAGYHIIQMIARRGEMINVRHILLRPKISNLDLITAKNSLDSLRKEIINENITFTEAVKEFSDDYDKSPTGSMINPYTGTTRFKSDEIEPTLFFALEKLEKGDITQPLAMQTDEGRQAFRIVKIIERIEPHKATLATDYDFIQQIVLSEKKRQATYKWIETRLPSTHVFIHTKFHGCSFEVNWLNK